MGSSTLYVDADIVLHRVMGANLLAFNADNPYFDEQGARRDFAGLLHAWTAAAPPHDRVMLAISDTRNFRKGIWAGYKANRPAKPAWFAAFRQAVIDEHQAIVLPGLEADDVIGLHMTDDPQSISCSIDKDFHSLPGQHWNPIRQTLTVVSPWDADLNWLRQALTGDPADGYPGIRGVGRVKAARLMPNPAHLSILWRQYLSAVQRSGGSRDEAVRNARLARILRKPEYVSDIQGIDLDRAVIWREPD